MRAEAGSREEDRWHVVEEVLVQAVVDQLLIVGAIDSRQWEGYTSFDLNQCGIHAYGALAPDARTLGPAGVEVVD